MNITEPLRLATGSHTAGSGRGCAMNLISWESGETTITDLPPCADHLLARLVQRVNDRICNHNPPMVLSFDPATSDVMSESQLLCPECSVKVLDLAHRTPGTTDHNLSQARLCAVRLQMAGEEVERAMAARIDRGARAQLDRIANSARRLATAGRFYDAGTEAYEAIVRSALALSCAEWNGETEGAALLATTHRVIDRFEQLTNCRREWQPAISEPEAIARMLETTG